MTPRLIALGFLCLAPLAPPATRASAQGEPLVTEAFRDAAREAVSGIRFHDRNSFRVAREDTVASLARFAEHGDPAIATRSIGAATDKLYDFYLVQSLATLSFLGSGLLIDHALTSTPRSLQAGAARSDWESVRRVALAAWEHNRARRLALALSALTRVERASPGFAANLALGRPLAFDRVAGPGLASDPSRNVPLPPVVRYVVAWSGPAGAGLESVLRVSASPVPPLLVRVSGPDGFTQSFAMHEVARALWIRPHTGAVPSDVFLVPQEPAAGSWRVEILREDDAVVADAVEIHVPAGDP